MDEEEILRRDARDTLSNLVKEDIDSLSVDELDHRISALRLEIERCEKRKIFAISHRTNAHDLFKR